MGGDGAMPRRETLRTLAVPERVKLQMTGVEEELRVRTETAACRGERVSCRGLHAWIAGASDGRAALGRYYGGMLGDLGIVRKDRLRCAGAEEFTGQSGETAHAAARRILEEARGGVLLLDEAGSLARDPAGTGALTALMEAMADPRDDLVLVLMGDRDSLADLLRLDGHFARCFRMFDLGEDGAGGL